jgi:hypothetical protein
MGIINYKKDENENTKTELNRINFKFELATKIKIRIGEKKYIEKIIELPYDKIGILYGIEYNKNLFLIYSSKTFTKIKQFEFFFQDAVKTEDNNLVLSYEYNIYYYELIDKEYKLIQEIQYYNKKEKIRCFEDCNYDSIDSIHSLKNGNLIAKIGEEMKIYKKDKGKFIYYKTINFKCNIEEIFEIKPNIIVLFLRERLGDGCLVEGYFHYISFYNIQNDKQNIININIKNIDDYYSIGKPFIKIGNHLIAKYADHLDIYDIEKNMKLINKDDYEIVKIKDQDSYTTEKKLKYEVPFSYFEEELKNNFIIASKRNGQAFVYKYEDKSFKKYQEFPFDLNGARLIKLKNDKIIIYYKDEIKVINVFY